MDDLLERRGTWLMDNCSVGRALDVLSTKSTLLLVREAFLGTRRFQDFAERVGLGEPTTAARLRQLTEAGILERLPYRENGQRTRYEYQLTQMGRDLMPVISALREWGDRWIPDEAGPPLITRHRECGGRLHVGYVCEHGHEVDVDALQMTAGPGLLERNTLGSA